MSDYTNTFDGATKDATNATILGVDFDTQYELIETMSATKADKVVSATADNMLTMDANGNLKDSGIAVAGLSTIELGILDGATVTTAELNILDGVTATTTEINYLSGVTSAIQTQMDLKAPLASPVLTGNPTAPTATPLDNDTSIATTAYVDAAVAVEAFTDTTVGDNIVKVYTGTIANNKSAFPTNSKLASVRMGQDGAVRIRFTMDNASQYVQYYKNGVDQGLGFNNTTGAKTIDATGLVIGDTVEIWGNSSTDGSTNDTLSDVSISIGTGNGIIGDWVIE